MRFGKALQRILDFILSEEPALGPTYLCKVDLTDVYMRIWVRSEDATPRCLSNYKGNGIQGTTSQFTHLVFHGIHGFLVLLLHIHGNSKCQVTGNLIQRITSTPLTCYKP